MQVLHIPGTGQDIREYFRAQNDHVLERKMDSRAKKLARQGYTVVRERRKVGRNESCPCGSGMKFKKCCIERAL